MAIDTTSTRSRRALLLGAVGGLGALAAQALGRPVPVSAEGEAMVVGGDYFDATSVTFLRNQTNNNDVFRAESWNHGGTAVTGASDSGVGVAGHSFSSNAVYGDSLSGAGGRFTGSPGVAGISNSGYGGFFNGGVAQLRLLPKSDPGKPTTGSHLRGEIYMDSRGALYLCAVGGTPGTWRKVVTKLA